MANEFKIKNGAIVSGSVSILSDGTPGLRVASNNDNNEEIQLYDAKLTIEDSNYELVTLATNINGNRLGSLQLANWTDGAVGVYLNGYNTNFWANWIGGALIVGRHYSVSSFQHHVALDVSGSAIVTGSLDVTEDLNLFGGDIDLKNGGSPSNVKLYCESANAHYTQIQAASHSAYSGNVLTVLPAYDFDFKNPNFQAAVTASIYKGDGSALTNLQRPLSGSVISNITASSLNAGFYFRCGGNVTCSIQSSSLVTCAIGSEFEFIQTSSVGNLLIKSGSSTITVNSKDGNVKLAGQFSAATLKKVGTDEWDLIGDLG